MTTYAWMQLAAILGPITVGGLVILRDRWRIRRQH